MNNLKIEQLRQSISALIGKSELDVGAVYFVLKDILREVEIAYIQQVQKENDEVQEKEKANE